MTLATLLLGIWVLLVGLTWAGVVEIGALFLGVWAIVTGILLLLEGLGIFSQPTVRK